MKLINKTQRIYFVLIIGLLVLWSGLFLYGISWAIQENIDEMLHSELISLLRSTSSQDITPISSRRINIKPIAEVRDSSITFLDTTLYNAVEQEPFPYRQVQTQAQFGGQSFEVMMRRSMVEYDDLFQAILVMEFIFVILLLGGLFVINKKVLQRLWQPFHNTLQQVTGYKIGRGDELNWQETQIEEFQQLNKVLKRMIRQVEQEYGSLKQFTENASHEIQTPLSVIANKAEILLQDETLTRQHGKNISTIHQTAGQLSRLNKALLMLTKIENKQFHQTENVNISQMLEQLLPDYQTLAQSKDIILKKEIESDIHLNVNADLAELMFRNLLGNAVKHNQPDGKICLHLIQHKFTISNTGRVSEENPKQFFERFNKGDSSTESLGLGLSIVSAIAQANDFELDYSVKGAIHLVNLNFSEN